MADNTTLPGTGDVIASDDISGVKYQIVKVSYGALNTATPVDAANPLPVTVISGGDGSVQGVDAHDAALTADPLTIGGYASAAAPTGVSADGDAARAWFLRNGAQCVNVTAAGALVGGDATNGLDVDVTRMPATVTEDAASAGGETAVLIAGVRNDSAAAKTSADGDFGNLAIDSAGRVGVCDLGGSVSIDDNGSSLTTDTTGTVAHDGVGTGASPVLGGGYASAAAPADVSADGDAVRAWHLRNGAQCVNITAAGTLIASGNGTAATALRVTLASDSTGVVDTELPAAAALADGAANPTTPMVGSALLSFNGTTWDRTLNGNGTAAKSLRVTLASDSTGIVGATCTGAAAHGASVSGNPVLNGLEARTAVGTAVTNGQAVRALGDVFGKQVFIPGALHEEQVGPTSVNFTNTTAADIIAAQGAGIKIAITAITITNAHATVGTKVTLRDKTTTARKFVVYAAAVGGGCALAGARPLLISDANSAIEAVCGTTGADVDVSISGYLIKN